MQKLYGFLFLACLLACTQNTKNNIIEPDKERMPAAPESWLYEQRAYPFDSINYSVYNQAFRTVQSKRAENNLERRKSNASDWELLGPTNVGGRVTDIVLNPNDPNIFFVGTSVGGIFKTTDRGQSWKAVFDKAGRLSIGDMAIAPSNTKVLYAGTGEANATATSGAFFGDGVYKSVNGGKSWTNMGLENSHHIGRVIVNPYNEDHVLVAAAGKLYDKNEERGLYESKDGGETWQNLLFVSDSTACIDVAMHPTDTNTIYAVTWERLRRPWQRTYAGPTSRIYRTRDGGKNWEIIMSGLPAIHHGRMGIAIAPSEPDVLYVSITENSITNSFNGLYKSINGGDNWRRTSDFFLSGMYSNFGWFFGQVRVDPRDANRAYVLGVGLFQTNNGGRAWNRIAQGVHVDQHALETHPKDSNMVVLGNDGGVYISSDHASTWTHLKNLPITQFYQCEVAQSLDNRYFGGTQDNGTIFSREGEISDWSEILGGDGFHVIVDPENPEIVYAEYQWGNLFRSVNGGQSFQWALNGVNSSDRNNWNTPIAIDPNNSNVLYYGTDRLYRSTSRASSWEAISGDLTKGPHPSGTRRFRTLTTIAVAPSDSEVIYVGADDGNVQMTSNGGDTWQLISSDLPERSITGIAVDFENPMKAYVSLSGYRNTDYLPHVFMTTDGGTTWEDISNGLPEVPANDVIIDNEAPNTLYLATDLGVWKQEDRTRDWEILGQKMPATVVTDLVLHRKKSELIAATFGRSLYKYALDVTPPDFPELDTTNIFPLTVYPNPIQEEAKVRFELERDQKGQTSIRDIQGRVIEMKNNLQFYSGENTLNIDAAVFPNTGDYVFTVIAGRKRSSVLLKVVE
ncbi:MAG: hypothetical protein AAF849_08005 [Bacteroidota bacterium]